MDNITADLKLRKNFSELFGELYTFHFKNIGGQMLVNLLAFVISVTYMILCGLIFSYSEVDAILGGVIIATFIIITFPVIYSVSKLFKVYLAETGSIKNLFQVNSLIQQGAVHNLLPPELFPEQAGVIENRMRIYGETLLKSTADTQKIVEALSKSLEEVVKRQEKTFIYSLSAPIHPDKIMVYDMYDLYRMETTKFLVEERYIDRYIDHYIHNLRDNDRIFMHLDAVLYDKYLREMDKSASYVPLKEVEVILFKCLSYINRKPSMVARLGEEMCAEERR